MLRPTPLLDREASIYLYVPWLPLFPDSNKSHPTTFYSSVLLVIIAKVVMITLLSDDYVAQPVTVNDLQIASLAWGFTIGFGFLTTWTAMRQTADMHRRYGYSKLNSPYIWMIWLEILVCLIFSVICWLHLNHIIPPRYLMLPPSIFKTQTNTRQFCILLRHP